ncbi:ERO1-domain-containing protein [Ceraceosorus guamensis]|uniref:ERO1-domain-containing protein n=1 Tax=Ceraceosorus guamensis TaxID=1522189 RepID=A0A316W2H8_9BASI|nr:ERO1-domain-containing protein [Ceraceosorus guamensis]PWN43889.1 ERO1-domain-containing protein [Ceraceosorus guamensis]
MRPTPSQRRRSAAAAAAAATDSAGTEASPNSATTASAYKRQVGHPTQQRKRNGLGPLQAFQTPSGSKTPLLVVLCLLLLLRIASRAWAAEDEHTAAQAIRQQQRQERGWRSDSRNAKAAALLFNSPAYRGQPGGLLHDVLAGPSGGMLKVQHPGSSGKTSGKSIAAEDEICRPTGQIEDACCDYETVERRMNTAKFFQTLQGLVETRYFRYYKVDLFKDCPFWYENGLCMNRACAVEKAEEDEVPDQYRVSHLSSLSTADHAEVFPPAVQGEDDSLSGSSCSCRETDFCHWEDEEESPEASWVDLVKNPERFTGYAGKSAQRVWRSIYEENCFGAPGAGAALLPSSSLGYVSKSQLSSPAGLPNLMSNLASPPDAGASEQCLEKRVFYRIISGLHASINIHLCHDYLLDNKQWGPNLECFVTRIAQHPERLQNVYFNYVLLLRALARAGDYVDAFVLRPGDAIAELETRTLLSSLVLQARSCPPSFDEGTMFAGPDAKNLKVEFKERFRNVSRIMDCVGCDKCRLWGKLQVNGIGTALKILFGHDRSDFDPARNPELLARSELVALINTVHRFAESLRAVATFRDMYQDQLSADKSADSVQQASKAQSPAEQVQGLSTGHSNVPQEPSAAPSSSFGSEVPQFARAPRSSWTATGNHTKADIQRDGFSVFEKALQACEASWALCVAWLANAWQRVLAVKDVVVTPYAAFGPRSGPARKQDEL